MRQLWHTRVWPFIDPLVNLLRLTDFYCASTFFRALVKKITLREYYGESLDSATAVLCYTFYLSYSALPLNEWLAVVWWQKAKVFCGFLFHFSHQLLMLFFATSYSPFCSFSLLSNFISTYLLLWLFFDILLFVVVVCLRYYANIKVFFCVLQTFQQTIIIISCNCCLSILFFKFFVRLNWDEKLLLFFLSSHPPHPNIKKEFFFVT